MVLDHVMKREILFSFIVNVGEMQHRLERCVDYAKTRKSFGKAIGSYQTIANKIVDTKIQLETARKWLYDTGFRQTQRRGRTAAARSILPRRGPRQFQASAPLHLRRGAPEIARREALAPQAAGRRVRA